MGKGQKTLLKIEDLVVCYGAVKVLHKISISIKEGEIVGVLGPNGAGKTTLLMTISGILRQNEGKILFKDKNLIIVVDGMDTGVISYSYRKGNHWKDVK